ncbi:MAG: NAD(P)-binding domain-containing protein [Bifidobacterium sp.]
MEHRISILGYGHAGASIAATLEKAGNAITVGLRNPGKLDGAVSIEEAIKASDIVIVALPYDAGYEVARQYSSELAGKIVIDMMNPLKADLSGFNTFNGNSGAEHVQQLLEDSTIIETFNHADAPVLANPRGALQFVVGNDASSVDTVVAIVKDAGFDAQGITDLSKTRELEAFAYFWIYFTAMQRKNMDLHLKLV